MKSSMTLDKISDGRAYDIDDMVKADTGGCDGCSACCHDVGDMVVLNPYDIYNIAKNSSVSFDELTGNKLNMITDGKIALPYLKMVGSKNRCAFLNENDRCSIHTYRPSICRLFPLGRFYEDDGFKYFLQIDTCSMKNLKEISVREWIGVEDYDNNKVFIMAWYKLLKALTFRVKFIRDDEELKSVNTFLQDTFFKINPKEYDDFYQEFFNRLPAAKDRLGIL